MSSDQSAEARLLQEVEPWLRRCKCAGSAGHKTMQHLANQISALAAAPAKPSASHEEIARKVLGRLQESSNSENKLAILLAAIQATHSAPSERLTKEDMLEVADMVKPEALDEWLEKANSLPSRAAPPNNEIERLANELTVNIVNNSSARSDEFGGILERSRKTISLAAAPVTGSAEARLLQEVEPWLRRCKCAGSDGHKTMQHLANQISALAATPDKPSRPQIHNLKMLDDEI